MNKSRMILSCLLAAVTLVGCGGTSGSPAVDSFKEGTWVAENDNGMYGYYYFYMTEEGKPGVEITYSMNETPSPSSYELYGDHVVFHLGKTENRTRAHVERIDEDHMTLYYSFNCNDEECDYFEDLSYIHEKSPEFLVTPYTISNANGKTIQEVGEANIIGQYKYENITTAESMLPDGTSPLYEDKKLSVYEDEDRYYIVDYTKDLYTIANKVIK